MISKTRLGKKLKRKTNQELVETLLFCKKNKNSLEIGKIISGSKRKSRVINLSELNKKINDEKKILYPGKVLSQGEFDKKTKIIALNFSESTKEKLNKKGISYNTILEEIKNNPELEDIKILKW